MVLATDPLNVVPEAAPDPELSNVAAFVVVPPPPPANAAMLPAVTL